MGAVKVKFAPMRAKWFLLLFLATLPGLARALGPHEILVLANGKSVDSVEVAKEFVRLRQVPEVNLVRVSLPASGAKFPVKISQEEFTRLVWLPATREARERGIDDHVLAWVYSVDFPIMINTKPPVSIQGLTFTRNKLPASEPVTKGSYASPLFADSISSKARPHFSQSLDVYKEWLGDEMPLPSMMLGYTGDRGNKKQTILAYLRKGVASDGTAPTGTVYFVTSGNVRSTCRHWQYPGAQAELKALGVRAVIGKEFPAGRTDVIGVMMGSAGVSPDRIGRCLPGCMGEHLTSFAGAFYSAAQTKLSAWLDAGATASAGTVVEPRSAWTKFPHARFFVHYASGCCMMESLFQSIRSPFEILLVGEPLARPWKAKADLVVHGLGTGSLSGVAAISARATTESGGSWRRFMYLLDGRTIGTGPDLDFDTTTVKDGSHAFRVVAYGMGLVRNQVFTKRQIVIRNR